LDDVLQRRGDGSSIKPLVELYEKSKLDGSKELTEWSNRLFDKPNLKRLLLKYQRTLDICRTEGISEGIFPKDMSRVVYFKEDKIDGMALSGLVELLNWVCHGQDSEEMHWCDYSTIQGNCTEFNLFVGPIQRLLQQHYHSDCIDIQGLNGGGARSFIPTSVGGRRDGMEINCKTQKEFIANRMDPIIKDILLACKSLVIHGKDASKYIRKSMPDASRFDVSAVFYLASIWQTGQAFDVGGRASFSGANVAYAICTTLLSNSATYFAQSERII
jgi:hypothetical protein